MIVLVYPKTGFDVEGGSVDLPMSVLSTATLLKQRVWVVDQRLTSNWKASLWAGLAQKPLCVGISCMTGPQIGHALEIADFVKTHSSVPVVFGGVHSTLLPEQTVSHRLIDHVVVGEGEEAFKRLADGLTGKEVVPPIVKAEGYVSLDALPPPPYHLLPMEKYIGTQGRFHDKRIRSLIFFASRGCPFRCGYCCNEELHRGSLRRMTAEEIYRRSLDLVERYRLDALMYHDEDFFIDKTRINELVRRMGHRPYSWWAQVRMDSLLRLDLDRLERAGLVSIQAGIESGCRRVLKFIRKGETREEMREANRKLAKTNIRPLYNFMMGFPTETFDEVMETVDFASLLLKENPKAEMTGFYIYVPYPGTNLYRVAIENGFVPPRTLEEWVSFTRQALLMPWLEERKGDYEAIRTMSKFIDGSRMLRRLKDGKEVGWPSLLFLKGLTKLYQHQWGLRRFGGTSWLSRGLFNW